jgi:hypothetical protein
MSKVQIMAGSAGQKSPQRYWLQRNFKLLLTQILCRRLNLGRGIVRLRVGSSYDRLRFFPCSYDLSSSLIFITLLG